MNEKKRKKLIEENKKETLILNKSPFFTRIGCKINGPQTILTPQELEEMTQKMTPIAKEYLIRCGEVESPFFMEKDKFDSKPVIWKKEYKKGRK